ncbi:MAG: hypothetical protein ACU843_07730, partial [Gammaproteobacteria bacterium]
MTQAKFFTKVTPDQKNGPDDFPTPPARIRILVVQNKEESLINSRTPLALSILAGTLLSLTGCATITTVTPDGKETTRTREEFEQYVESVFRRQNRASLEAGQLLDEELSAADSREIATAERYMLKACSALNQVVAQKMEQNDPGILLEMKVKDTIGEC